MSPEASVNPLSVLLRANLLQAWRRLKAVRDQSRLLSALILVFICGYLALAFGLFYGGLRFASRFPGLGAMLTERLMFLLFAFLFVLLLFSNIVISFTNFFKNRETQFLLSLPVGSQAIFRWKFIESCLLASWAFLFLIAPLLAAFGLTRNVPWHFYAVTAVLMALFIVLPGVAGAWISITLARFMDRRVFQLCAIATVLLLIPVGMRYLRPEPITDEMLETRVLAVLDQILSKTRFADFALLPSYWLSKGILNWADGARSVTLMFGLVLLSYTVFFGFLAFTRTGRIFYDGVSAVASRESVFGHWEWWRHRRERTVRFDYEVGVLERLLGRLKWIDSDVRALMVKDARMFWRDTTQWGQTLVLFGLLGAYIVNLRHFTQQLTNPFWVHLVSILNLLACSLNLATLTTRFVYPQFSLEGKRLWIVGMAPLGLARVLRTKFWESGAASLILTLGLIWLSCHMLKLPLERTLFFVAAITVMTFTLNGLAVGLGALYPNFKEDNPGKIVSGFGGTLCLVLSFLYIVASVVLVAIGSPWGPRGARPWAWSAAGLAGFALLSWVLGRLPFQLALKRLKSFEY